MKRLSFIFILPIAATFASGATLSADTPSRAELYRVAGDDLPQRPPAPIPGAPVDVQGAASGVTLVTCSVTFQQIVEENRRIGPFRVGRIMDGWGVSTCADWTFSVHVYGDVSDLSPQDRNAARLQERIIYPNERFQFRMPFTNAASFNPARLVGIFHKDVRPDGTWSWAKDGDPTLAVLGPSPRFAAFKIEIAAVAKVIGLLQ